MDSIDYLRDEIKSYFPESTELQLSSRYDKQPRFNFYFQIVSDYRYLLYLNWDGEGYRFTLKCLEFSSKELLSQLIADYTDGGSRVFNVGQPKSTISFIYREKDNLSGTEFKGTNSSAFDSNAMSGKELMQCVDPAYA
ncbi:hypothetical protein [Dyadobacter sp. CY312]|uniref:hypothetical protein n=1 Tax=Dyadobacter sp. CY312 TaxID=2907303 RepID=UPI001F17D7CD|nr:hypothetical protein [Dyadobacter sp. CY312]MCE7040281.1 hypothetical protein [Dyadobacter sp. CY312]